MSNVPSLPWTRINDFLLRVCAAKNTDEFNAMVGAHISDLIPHDFPVLCLTFKKERTFNAWHEANVRSKLVDPSTLAIGGEPGTVLTRREQEIAFLLSEKLSMPEIADRLFISCRTVEKHAENIYGKLGVRRKREVGEHLLSVPSFRV